MQLISLSEGWCTYLVSFLQMTLRKAYSDTKAFLPRKLGSNLEPRAPEASAVTTELPGLEVIKLQYILRLKIKLNDWLLADTCVCKQPIIELYFESENVLKFYNLETRLLPPWLMTAINFFTILGCVFTE